MRFILLTFLLVTAFHFLNAQDTFSIVALDSLTGEVGSAGASCVDMDNFPGFDDDFLGELFPGVGAINTQAFYNSTNQANARNRMNSGDSPQQIIDWLIENDVSGNPQIRQYGIVAITDDGPESAAHTGTLTNDYKGHLLGPDYSIQGNILLGSEVLENMEERYLAESGELACKLMAALQGAKMVGADSRCTNNGSSSLFAFIKVAQPDDVFGEPSFLLSVRTKNGDGIEPVDSLQVLFDQVKLCETVGITNHLQTEIRAFPNPFRNSLKFVSPSNSVIKTFVRIYSSTGFIMFEGMIDDSSEVQTQNWPEGLYIIQFELGNQVFTQKLIK